MKRRLLSLLLAISLVFSITGVLSACGDQDDNPSGTVTPNPEDTVLTPVGADKSEDLVTTLTSTELSAIIAAVGESLKNSTVPDVGEMIKDVDLYANVPAVGSTLSIKGGYITSTNGTSQSVVAFKDGYMITVEDDQLSAEAILPDDGTKTEEALAMVQAIVSAVEEIGLLPAPEKGDLYRSAEWYFFTDAYVEKFVKNAAYTYFMLMSESETAPELTEEVKAELDALVTPILEAFNKIKLGFSMDGEAINGIILSVQIGDFTKLGENIAPASARVRIEAKTLADLTGPDYFKLDTKLTSQGQGEKSEIALDALVDFDYPSKNEIKLNTALNLGVDMNGGKIKAAATSSFAVSADGGVKADLKATVDTNMMSVDSNSVVSENWDAYVQSYCDAKITVSASLDSANLAKDGKIFTTNVDVITSNPRIEVTSISSDGEMPTDSEILAVLGEEEKADMLDISDMNVKGQISFSVIGKTAKLAISTFNEGEWVETMAIDFEIDSTKTTLPSEAVQEMINSFNPLEEAPNDSDGDQTMKS